jgi:NADPH:quinone reductase and related Zn-dependent oxidoreductases
MFQAQGFEHVFVIGEEFRGEVEAALGPRPIHVVYDAIGGAIAKPSLSLLAFGGRYLVIGFAAGEPPLFPANHLLVKNVDVVGFYWGAYVHHDPNQFGAVMTRLMEKVSASEIQPQYTELRGFSGAMEGLKLLKQRNAKGKIVVNLTENG